FLREKEIRYLGTKATTCKSCHKDDDVHFYKGDFAKKDCQSCHNNVSWKEKIQFNHNLDTKYKLTETHAELKCNDCHLIDKKKKLFQYQWSHLNQKQCLSCHQDFHKNKLSSKFSNGECTKCHNQTKWSISKFDHGVTGYHLLGKHKEAQCIECHKVNKKQTSIKDLNFTGLKNNCLSCHQDFHFFGSMVSKKSGKLNQCSQCHEESSWKNTHNFNHNKDTSFSIDGKHLDLKCNDCHLPGQKVVSPKKSSGPLRPTSPKKPIYHWAQLNLKTCETCHKSPHQNEFSKELLNKKCTSCHTTQDWFIQKSDTGFDHDKTKFQLTGAHKSAKCSDCHGETRKKKFKFKSEASRFCIDCHKNIHEKQFKFKQDLENCSQCHSTEKFSPLSQFDHSETKYQLKEAHETLKCADCHQPSLKNYTIQWPSIKSKNHTEQLQKPMSIFHFPNLKSKTCLQCHDDFHKGQLDQSCNQCHNEKNWKTVSFNHNKQSQFALVGKHTEVKCSKCHVLSKETVLFKKETRNVVKFKPLSSLCFDCHKDPHKGSFGKTCQECHSEKGWSSTKDFHKNFTLNSVHYTIECSECHKDGKKLAGLSQQCLACHQKDDVHNGSSPNCKDCHTQHFWEATSFRHSLTKFPLRGAHRVIECSECHSNGVYKGLSSNCYTCHDSEFIANPSPHTSGNTSCIDCHKNTFTFKNVN
ncbi:MAG TPA: hypothetical protein PLJ21_04840, partial [Pseudobdellovibrionaceae bacterium]|nr:hypothetical protein [Pseudobdellovibrionaceae bacterium]